MKYYIYFLYAGGHLANIEESVILEMPTLDPANQFQIDKGMYSASELVNRLNQSLSSCQLEIVEESNAFQLKYKFVQKDPSKEEQPSLSLTRQLCFKIGLIPFHEAIKTNRPDNYTTVRIQFNRPYYLDTISHLTNLSIESSGNTFNYHKLARVDVTPEKIQGLIIGNVPFATFELTKNWSSIVVRNQDLNVCKLQLYDMLNCKVNLFYIEIVMDFHKLLILK